MYGKKVIKRDIYQIIIPMILENILQISANLVITAMVGRLLANDISAQGICIRITDTLWCFYKGVAIGATVLIARAYGAGRHQDCRKIAEQTILTEMIIVFIFQVVLYFKAPLFLGFFSKDPQILSLAEGYMKTIIFEFPFVVITTVVTASSTEKPAISTGSPEFAKSKISSSFFIIFEKEDFFVFSDFNLFCSFCAFCEAAEAAEK